MSDFEQRLAEIATNPTTADVASLVRALHVVAEVHQPWDRRVGPSKYKTVCFGCRDEDGQLWVPYPCLTVRAVWNVLDPSHTGGIQ